MISFEPLQYYELIVRRDLAISTAKFINELCTSKQARADANRPLFVESGTGGITRGLMELSVIMCGGKKIRIAVLAVKLYSERDGRRSTVCNRVR